MTEQVGAMGGEGFIEAVREIAAKTSQGEVARKAGIDPSTISRMLSGERTGHMVTVMRLLEAYPELRRFFVSRGFPNCNN